MQRNTQKKMKSDMKKNNKLTVHDINIGDVVEIARGFEMVVTSIFWAMNSDPTDATLYLDFEGNEGDVLEEDLKDVKLIRKWNEK